MTAGTGEGLGEFRGGLGAAAIDQLIKIDGQECRRRSDECLAPVMGINVENVRRNDVLPAMVFEIVAHVLISHRRPTGRPKFRLPNLRASRAGALAQLGGINTEVIEEFPAWPVLRSRNFAIRIRIGTG